MTLVISQGLAAAIAYAKVGLAVLPNYTPKPDGTCDCYLGAQCDSVGKHPRTRNGVHDATTDEQQICRWWSIWPHANVGIATGRKSGVIVLDIDPRNGGDESLKRLIDENSPLPLTMVVRTGSGGRHFYFACPPDRPVASIDLVHRGYSGLELKSDGYQVIAPPSLHASGGVYAWKTGPWS